MKKYFLLIVLLANNGCLSLGLEKYAQEAAARAQARKLPMGGKTFHMEEEPVEPTLAEIGRTRPLPPAPKPKPANDFDSIMNELVTQQKNATQWDQWRTDLQNQMKSARNKSNQMRAMSENARSRYLQKITKLLPQGKDYLNVSEDIIVQLRNENPDVAQAYTTYITALGRYLDQAKKVDSIQKNLQTAEAATNKIRQKIATLKDAAENAQYEALPKPRVATAQLKNSLKEISDLIAQFEAIERLPAAEQKLLLSQKKLLQTKLSASKSDITKAVSARKLELLKQYGSTESPGYQSSVKALYDSLIEYTPDLEKYGITVPRPSTIKKSR